MDYELSYHLSETTSHKPVLVLLHGFMGDGHDWDETAAYFSEDFRILAVDLPGHGESLPVSDRYITITGVAVMLRDLFDTLEIDQAHVVGYSMGGRLALNFAVYFPERCLGVVAESASPGLETAKERLLRIKHDERLAERLEESGLDEFVHNWYEQPLFQSLKRFPKVLNEMITRRLLNDPVELVNSLRMLGAGMMAPLWHKLADSKVPLLFIAGELDEKYRDVARRLGDLCPSAEVRIIPGAGHIVHVEQPMLFRRAIRKFLSRKD